MQSSFFPDNQPQNYKSLKKLDIALLPGEYMVGIGVSEFNQLVMWSNAKRVWVSTFAPTQHFDMVEITGINKGNKQT